MAKQFTSGQREGSQGEGGIQCNSQSTLCTQPTAILHYTQPEKRTAVQQTAQKKRKERQLLITQLCWRNLINGVATSTTKLLLNKEVS